MIPIEPGRVVLSRAGRDKGRLLAVIGVEGEYAYVADGKLRTMEKPKKKKIKHLLPQKEKLEGLQEAANRDSVAYDAQLRASLKMIRERGGVNTCQKTT